jgi:maltooligosyltrehalose trehalohydrolase
VRSKLTRREDPELAKLYRDLLRVRRELPAGDVDAAEYDDEAGVLRVQRGAYTLVANFGTAPATVAGDGTAVVLHTPGGVSPAGGDGPEGALHLAAHAGILLG